MNKLCYDRARGNERFFDQIWKFELELCKGVNVVKVSLLFSVSLIDLAKLLPTI